MKKEVINIAFQFPPGKATHLWEKLCDNARFNVMEEEGEVEEEEEGKVEDAEEEVV